MSSIKFSSAPIRFSELWRYNDMKGVDYINSHWSDVIHLLHKYYVTDIKEAELLEIQRKKCLWIFFTKLFHFVN